MNDPKIEMLKALGSMAFSLGSLIAGVVFIGLGTNAFVATGVLFLILYVNAQKG